MSGDEQPGQVWSLPSNLSLRWAYEAGNEHARIEIDDHSSRIYDSTGKLIAETVFPTVYEVPCLEERDRGRIADVTGIVEFLTARLDEDELIARAASERAPWSHHADDYWMITGTDGDVVVYDESAPTAAEAAHIARHDPARVLAEVAAKRELLEAITVELVRLDGVYESESGASDDVAGQLLRMLVRPYSEHPHFHPAWAR